MKRFKYFVVLAVLGLSGISFAQGTWTVMQPMCASVGWGGTLEWTGDDYIFGLRGWVNGVTNPREFYRYRISVDNWTSMTDFNYDPYWGAGLAWDGSDHIYACNGNGNGYFSRYSISGNSWETRAPAPESGIRHTGDALAWAGGDYIYLLKGNNQAYFWCYSISGNSWNWMTNAPGTVDFGGSLAWDGDQSLYALRGGSTTDFWRYDIPSGTWYSLAPTPGPVSEGGNLVSDHYGYIYAYQGNDIAVWRYSTTRDSWTELASVPDTVRLGSALSWAQGGLYALQGDFKDGFWRFDGYDLEVYQMESPNDTIPADSAVTPAVNIRNTGTLTASGYSVMCRIDSSGVNVYQETMNPVAIDPQVQLLVDFPQWTPPYPGNCMYDIYFIADITDDFDAGNDTLHSEIWVGDPVGIEGPAQGPIESALLLQNVPNPMHSMSEITFRVPGTTRAELSIYDISGRCVSTLMDEVLQGGEYSCTWNGIDKTGRSVENGLYLYRLSTSEGSVTRSLIVLR